MNKNTERLHTQDLGVVALAIFAIGLIGYEAFAESDIRTLAGIIMCMGISGVALTVIVDIIETIK